MKHFNIFAVPPPPSRPLTNKQKAENYLDEFHPDLTTVSSWWADKVAIDILADRYDYINNTAPKFDSLKQAVFDMIIEDLAKESLNPNPQKACFMAPPPQQTEPTSAQQTEPTSAQRIKVALFNHNAQLARDCQTPEPQTIRHDP